MSTTRILKVPWLVFNGHTSLRLDLYIYMQEYVYACYASDNGFMSSSSRAQKKSVPEG